MPGFPPIIAPSPRSPNGMPNPLWFKDAVIYEVHVKTFQDSDGDGIGDFRGLLQRLDYFVELGITAIWLLPFYPSPLRDDGYDIADYCAVNPVYGTLDDFRLLLEEAHNRGLRVITELVLNHTSDQNPWFQKARNAPAGSPERDFYVWSDEPRKYRGARIIFKDFESSNWTWDPVAKAYFWHRFYSHQPDLNFDNPAVHEEMLRVIDFWLEMGVDGVRLDAVPYLYEREGTNCENLPETHDFLRKLRSHIDAKFEDRMLLAEANQWPEDAAAYFGEGNECHMEFHFPLMPRMFMALQMEDRFPIIDILEQTPAIPESCQWAIFLRNHDELTLEMVTDEERDYMYLMYAQDPRARINLGIRRRLAPLLGNNRRKIELINSLLFSLPGTPIIYYGDEIGMGDNFYLGDRNGVRTPMQWSPDRNAGFSKANPQQLYLPTIIDPEYHYESVNVENQQKNLSSLYWWMRRLLVVRQQSSAFARGTIEFLHPGNAKVLAFVRKHEQEVILVVANLSRFTQCVELDLSVYAGMVPVEMFGRTRFPEVTQALTVFALSPHAFNWLALTSTASPGEAAWTALPLAQNAEWNGALAHALRRAILPTYLPLRRWFGGKGRIIREVEITQNIAWGWDDARLLVVEAAFTEGSTESYLMPVAFAKGEEAKRLSAEMPQAVLATFKDEQILCDALYLPEFRSHLFHMIASRHKGQDTARLAGTCEIDFDAEALAKALVHTRVLSVEQSNTSVIYGDVWFLKFLRKFELGRHPEQEMSQFLSHGASFEHVAQYGGALKLTTPMGEGIMAMLVRNIQHQGDGWTYTLDALARYFDRILEVQAKTAADGEADLIGPIYPERARQLGQITAELHLTLAGSTLADFAPEPFSALYQRSLYQSMRSSSIRALRQLQQARASLPDSLQADATALLDRQKDLQAVFQRLLDHSIEAMKIRVHGDFHLGQVLNTGNDFIVIDFEGDPRQTLSDRRLKRPALWDVACMLRSFDYAALAALRRAREDDARLLEPWARSWVAEISRHFQEAYFEKTAGASWLPPQTEDTQMLLEVFLLNKAMCEISYELSYRPDFVSHPLRAANRMLDERQSLPAPEVESP